MCQSAVFKSNQCEKRNLMGFWCTSDLMSETGAVQQTLPLVNCQSRNKKKQVLPAKVVNHNINAANCNVPTMMLCIHCLCNKHNQTYHDLLTNNLHKY